MGDHRLLHRFRVALALFAAAGVAVLFCYELFLRDAEREGFLRELTTVLDARDGIAAWAWPAKANPHSPPSRSPPPEAKGVEGAQPLKDGTGRGGGGEDHPTSTHGPLDVPGRMTVRYTQQLPTSYLALADPDAPVLDITRATHPEVFAHYVTYARRALEDSREVPR
ncbi:hypothetical protein ACVNF4_03455 [Streptomyces sp. S6]